MADFVFNIAKGRVAELYNRVDTNDPANSVLVVMVLSVTGDQDAAMKDVDDVAALTGLASVAEVTNTGYARIVLDDLDLAAFAPDDTNDRVDLDLADFTWTSVAAGSAWTDVVIGYDNDSTLGTDANIIPLVNLDFVITPDGSNITANLNAAGFYRAT